MNQEPRNQEGGGSDYILEKGKRTHDQQLLQILKKDDRELFFRYYQFIFAEHREVDKGCKVFTLENLVFVLIHINYWYFSIVVACSCDCAFS